MARRKRSLNPYIDMLGLGIPHSSSSSSSSKSSSSKPIDVKALLTGAHKLAEGTSAALSAFLPGKPYFYGSQNFGMQDFGIKQAPNVMSGTKHPAPKALTPGSGAGKGTTQEDIAAAARAAIAAQYSPALGLLGKQIHRTKAEGRDARQDARKRGQRAVGDLAELYGRLGRYSNRQRHEGLQDYRHQIHDTRSGYHDLRENINENYAGSNDRTAKELRRLGIDPAEALAGSAEDQRFLNNLVSADRHSKVGNLRESRGGYNENMKQLRSDIRATGVSQIGQSRDLTNTAINDLAKQVADNVFQLRMQRAQLRGQESGALAAQRVAELQAQQQAEAPMSPEDRIDLKYKKAQLAKLLQEISNPDGGSPDTTGMTPLQKGLSQLSQNGANDPRLASMINLMNYLPQGHNYDNPDYVDYTWRKEDYSPIWAAVQRTGVRRKYSQQEMNWLDSALKTALGI